VAGAIVRGASCVDAGVVGIAGAAMTNPILTDLAELGVRDNDEFNALKKRSPKTALPFLQRLLDQCIVAGAAAEAANDHELASRMMVYAFVVREHLLSTHIRAAHLKTSSNGGLVPKEEPKWVEPAELIIAEILAKNPNAKPWAIAGEIVKKLGKLGINAPEQQAVFKYIKKHGLITKS
jgi:hypothetical protein